MWFVNPYFAQIYIRNALNSCNITAATIQTILKISSITQNYCAICYICNRLSLSVRFCSHWNGEGLWPSPSFFMPTNQTPPPYRFIDTLAVPVPCVCLSRALKLSKFSLISTPNIDTYSFTISRLECPKSLCKRKISPPFRTQLLANVCLNRCMLVFSTPRLRL